MSRSFTSPALVRLLGDSTLTMDVDTASRHDFAERLSQWLSPMDTVTLHSALQPAAPVAKGPAPQALRASASAVAEAVHQVREALVRAIMAVAWPPEAAPDERVDYLPYQKHHQALQRQMESKIGPLRARVRQALSQASPALRQLAVLDALMDKTLALREQKLLSSVPVFLERSLERGRQDKNKGQGDSAHQKTLGQAWQDALLAELDTRLQPVIGLMEAFSNEVDKQP